MKKIVHKIILYVLKKLWIHEKIERLNINANIERCLRGTISKDIMFYKETSIENYQDNPSKIRIGNKSVIKGQLLVFAYDGEITIGENTFVGENTRIWSGEKIEIGNNVLISHNVNIIDSNTHEMNAIERAESISFLFNNGHSKNKGSLITNPIIINDYAWISYNVSILKGITIGKGAIVAAGAVVTKNVAPFTLVAGNPAELIKELKESF